MPEDDRPSPETEPPGPQPEDADPRADEGDPAEETTEDPSVDKTSADSFPASDPPSW